MKIRHSAPLRSNSSPGTPPCSCSARDSPPPPCTTAPNAIVLRRPGVPPDFFSLRTLLRVFFRFLGLRRSDLERSSVDDALLSTAVRSLPLTARIAAPRTASFGSNSPVRSLRSASRLSHVVPRPLASRRETERGSEDAMRESNPRSGDDMAKGDDASDATEASRAAPRPRTRRPDRRTVLPTTRLRYESPCLVNLDFSTRARTLSSLRCLCRSMWARFRRTSGCDTPPLTGGRLAEPPEDASTLPSDVTPPPRLPLRPERLRTLAYTTPSGSWAHHCSHVSLRGQLHASPSSSTTLAASRPHRAATILASPSNVSLSVSWKTS